MAETIAPGMYTSKDFDVKSLDLINSAGQTISLKNIMVELKIQQSIDAMVMFGTILVVDGNDLFNSFYLNGNEYLRIRIDQPTLGIPLEKLFRVYKVSDRRNNNNAGSKYIIYFTSDELMISNTTLVSKAYKNRKTSEIVFDILKSFLLVSDKKISKLENTTGVHNFIVPNYRPFEAINWAVSRSYSVTPSFCYYFYENTKGFEFISLQSLYKKSVTKELICDMKGINKEPNLPVDIARNKNSFENLTIINDFDMIASSGSGAFASKLLSVNLYSQQFKYNDYSILTAQNQKRLLNNYSPINDPRLMTSYLANYKTYISTNDTATEKENAVDKWLMNRQLHKNLINNFRVRGIISGDITMNVGDIVNLTFPKYVAADAKGKQYDEFRSGKYLVADITHVFKSSGIFESVVELTSDSYASQLPSGRNVFNKVAS